MDEYLYIIVKAEQLLNPPSPTLPKGEREELERLSTINHRLEIIRCTYLPRVVLSTVASPVLPHAIL